MIKINSEYFQNLLKAKYFIFFSVFLIFCLTIYINIYHVKNKYDDSYIGYRISKNIFLGNGAIYNINSRIKTNTSLLYPCITSPAFFFSDEVAIKLIDIFDSALYSIAVVFFALVFSGLLEFGFLWSKLLVFGLTLLSIFANQNIALGMETQLYLALIGASLFVWFNLKNEMIGYIIASFLVFVRPDGILLPACYFITSLSYSRRNLLRFIFVSGFTMILYFGITYFYYDEIIPHTAKVKNLFFQDKSLEFQNFLNIFIIPSNFTNKTSFLFLAGLCFCFLRRKTLVVGLFTILYFVFFTFKATWFPGFGWYAVPFTFFYKSIMVLGLVSILDFLFSMVSSRIPIISKAILGLGFLFFIVVQLRCFKENVVVLQIASKNFTYRLASASSAGFYLKSVVKSNQKVLIEPLGIVGFYAWPVSFKDFPGLTNIEVYNTIVKFQNSGHFFVYGTNTNEFNAILKDNPDIGYAVLRKRELNSLLKSGILAKQNIVFNFTKLPSTDGDENLYVVKL